MSNFLDFKMFLQPTLYGYYGTFLIGDGDVILDDYIGTAITITLGTNLRVEDNDRPDNGWWGEEVLGLNIGSRLYLLDRSKAIQATIQLANQYAEEDLAWMVDEGYITSIDQVSTTYIGEQRYQINIVFTTVDGEIRNHRHIFSTSEGV